MDTAVKSEKEMKEKCNLLEKNYNKILEKLENFLKNSSIETIKQNSKRKKLNGRVEEGNLIKTYSEDLVTEYLDKSDNTVTKIQYKQNKVVKTETYDANKKLINTMIYDNNENFLQGEIYENGQLITKLKYKNGEIIEKIEYTQEKGRKKEKITKYDDNGKVIGRI